MRVPKSSLVSWAGLCPPISHPLPHLDSPWPHHWGMMVAERMPGQESACLLGNWRLHDADLGVIGGSDGYMEVGTRMHVLRGAQAVHCVTSVHMQWQ